MRRLPFKLRMFGLILLAQISYASPPSSKSCLPWLQKVGQIMRLRRPPPRDIRDVTGIVNPVEHFYTQIMDYHDPVTKVPYFLPGKPSEKVLSFKGQPLKTFHELRRARGASERLVVYGDRIAVAKFFESADYWDGRRHGFKSRFLTEVLTPDYLKKDAQLNVSQILDYSIEDRILIKEFIPGFPMGSINTETGIKVSNEKSIAYLGLEGFLTEPQYLKIQSSFDTLISRCQGFNARQSPFKKWAQGRNLIPYVDLTYPDATLYWNGRWYINSPYPL